MIETILSVLSIDIPRGSSTVDVSQEICSALTEEEFEKLKTLEIQGASKEMSYSPEFVIVSFRRPLGFFVQKELRIVWYSEKDEKCKAYLFKHAL